MQATGDGQRLTLIVEVGLRRGVQTISLRPGLHTRNDLRHEILEALRVRILTARNRLIRVKRYLRLAKAVTNTSSTSLAHFL